MSEDDARAKEPSEAWMPYQRLGVSAEKAYDLELNHARQEILARLGFSRQLLGFQLALIAGSSGIFAATLRKDNGTLIEGVATVLVWVVFAVEGAGRVNWDVIVVLSRYIDQVLNRKYKFQGVGDAESLKLYEWTDFLDGKHLQSMGKKAPSVTSATEILNFILVVIALSAFFYSLCVQIRGSVHNLYQFSGDWVVPWIFSAAMICGLRVNFKWLSGISREVRHAIRVGQNDLSTMPKDTSAK